MGKFTSKHTRPSVEMLLDDDGILSGEK